MRELLEKIAYTAIRLKKGMVYFFDNDGIYNRVSVEQGKKIILKGLLFRNDGSAYLYNDLGNITGTNNKVLSKKAICQLKIGDNIERLEYYLKNVQFEHHEKPQGLDRFITKIKKPEYIKSPENERIERLINVFDYIHIDINIVSEWEEDRRKYIEKHENDILQRAIEMVENDENFKRYGVTVNILKVGIVTLTRRNTLDVVIEVKEK